MASWPPPSELEAAWNERADASETNPNSGPRAADVLPMPTVSGTSTGMPAAKKKKPAKRGVFVCPEPQCGKTFPRSFALRRHQRIHTGTKPYACDFAGCAQRFNTSGNLSRHKRIHSGERPYPCIFATCGKRFNTSTKLKRHMRIHFPEGHNLFRCVGVECSWSCDNYKEFAQHQKLHHNVIVGAQSSNAARAGSAAAVNAAPPAKDNEYFSAADTTSRLEYDAPPAAAAPYHPTGAFLYGPPYDKAKATGAPPPPAQPPRHKPMGQFFASDLNALASLPALHKDKKPPLEDLAAGAYAAAAASGAASLYARGKPPAAAFPSAAPPYRTSAAFDSFDGGYARPAVSAGYAPHYGGHHDVDEEEDPDDGYGHGHGHGQPQHQPAALPHALHGHVLRPPPQGSEDGGGFKLGAFQVPPPMNPAAPEFTGEELSVVLQLMDGNYC